MFENFTFNHKFLMWYNNIGDNMKFKLQSEYTPKGDQVRSISELVDNINSGVKEQVLLGATGTGKTFTICNVIDQINKPTLVLAHNKTLAGQLYSEFKEFFPENRVELFISYYDYYQPEAYVAASDTYIEKDSKTNDEIDQLRHSATASLLERKDVIVIASVSCIYGIGDKENYANNMLVVRKNQEFPRKQFIQKLIDLRYTRNDTDFSRGSFRARGDVLELIPAYEQSNGIRFEYFDDEIERIREFDVLTGKALRELEFTHIYPGSQFMTDPEKFDEAINRIEDELEIQIKHFKDNNQLIEAQRIEQRTNYDIEMLREVGVCSGIENYSRHMALRDEGETPSTLMHFFDQDFLLVVDESHVTLPQVRGMYNGDRARKMNLVNYGFRLPSALDNRPMYFEEFENVVDKAIYVSATPGDYELTKDIPVVEQIIRPTGLLDPEIEIREEEGQIDDLLIEIRKRVALNERILVTTLTIKMSEELTAYLKDNGVKVAYLHSQIKSLERLEILHQLRKGDFDVLVGINLLREGLDLPEVSLVAILDANKQGFLRSARSLIQTSGRAARNSNGQVIMYANTISDAMKQCIDETYRRREIQQEYNEKHNITPTTINKSIRDVISIVNEIAEDSNIGDIHKMKKTERKQMIKKLEEEMLEAAKNLDFEKAASLRDLVFELKAL